MRTTHITKHPPHTWSAMDAMCPWQAFGAPPAPAALDPRRWLGVALAMLAGVGAWIARPGARAQGLSGAAVVR
jgi:hypothetical protein